MKVILILLSFFILSNSNSQTLISLEDVSNKVRNSNFMVLENAQRVYQAKETINFNKKNLLPKLNLWNILRTPFTWQGAVDIVQDIAPFLVPNNWFKVGQSRQFYYAYQE